MGSPLQTILSQYPILEALRNCLDEIALQMYEARGWKTVRWSARARQFDGEFGRARSVKDRYTLKTQLYDDVVSGKLRGENWNFRIAT